MMKLKRRTGGAAAAGTPGSRWQSGPFRRQQASDSNTASPTAEAAAVPPANEEKKDERILADNDDESEFVDEIASHIADDSLYTSSNQNTNNHGESTELDSVIYQSSISSSSNGSSLVQQRQGGDPKQGWLESKLTEERLNMIIAAKKNHDNEMEQAGAPAAGVRPDGSGSTTTKNLQAHQPGPVDPDDDGSRHCKQNKKSVARPPNHVVFPTGFKPKAPKTLTLTTAAVLSSSTRASSAKKNKAFPLPDLFQLQEQSVLHPQKAAAATARWQQMGDLPAAGARNNLAPDPEGDLLDASSLRMDDPTITTLDGVATEAAAASSSSSSAAASSSSEASASSATSSSSSAAVVTTSTEHEAAESEHDDEYLAELRVEGLVKDDEQQHENSGPKKTSFARRIKTALLTIRTGGFVAWISSPSPRRVVRTTTTPSGIPLQPPPHRGGGNNSANPFLWKVGGLYSWVQSSRMRVKTLVCIAVSLFILCLALAGLSFTLAGNRGNNNDAAFPDSVGSNANNNAGVIGGNNHNINNIAAAGKSRNNNIIRKNGRGRNRQGNKVLHDRTEAPPLRTIAVSSAMTVSSSLEQQTSSSSSSCVEDPQATFMVNQELQTCKWLAKDHWAMRHLLCQPSRDAYDRCPKTCNRCNKK